MSRIAIVTGGTRGIGAAISLILKKEGYKVIANYHANHDAAKNFSERYGIITKAWDVRNGIESSAAIQEIQKEHGSVDILVHNAGITKDSFLHKMSFDHWHQVIQTNLESCFNIIRPLIESMRQRNFGRIVFMSSINALKGQMGQTNYCAAKAGIIGFAKALALESASKDITVNVIAPGYVETEMVQSIAAPILEKIIAQIPKGRLAQAEEIARAVSFLVKDESSYITGETLNINGGLYLS